MIRHIPHLTIPKLHHMTVSRKVGFLTRQRLDANACLSVASIGSYDDASPTRGFPALGKDTADKHSSWDRVRQQALTGKSSSSDSTSPKSYNQAIGSSGGDKWQRRRQEVPAGGDSFTFSTTDKDKQLAKAEAKKEFEAMLDRERRGENP